MYFNLFDDLFNDDYFAPAKKVSSMKTDIYEQGDDYVLAIELPGINKEQVKLNLKDGYLTVSVTASEVKEGNMIRSERYHGDASRSFYVGEEFKPEYIKARFENGELFITLPKEAPKKIEETHYINID